MSFTQKILVVLKTFQVLISLTGFGCGVYVVLTLLSIGRKVEHLASDTEQIFADVSIKDKDVFDKFCMLIAHIFTHPPIRAYILAAVSVWSLLTISYLLIAQRAVKYPWLNKRSIVIPLQGFTALTWLAALVAVAMLVVEYGPLCLAFEYLGRVPDFHKVLSEIPILDDISPLCKVIFAAAVAAAISCALWCITSLAACCIDRNGHCCGDRRKIKNVQSNETQAHEMGLSRPMEYNSTLPLVAGASLLPSLQKGSFLVKGTPLSLTTPASQYYSTATQSYPPTPQYYLTAAQSYPSTPRDNLLSPNRTFYPAH